MTNVVIGILIQSSICLGAFGWQDPSNRNPASAEISATKANLYSLALSAYLDERARVPAMMGSSEDPKVLIVERNTVTRGFPEQFGQSRVSYLDSQGLAQKYRADKKAFPMLEVGPITNSGNDLVIPIARWVISYRGKTQQRGYYHAYAVILRFDCEKQAYSVQSVKYIPPY